MRLHHLAFLMLINLIWAFNFIAVRWSVDELPPIFVTALRFVAVAILLFPFLRISIKHFKSLIVTALVMSVGHFGLMYLGIALSGGLAAVAVATLTNVPFATLLAIFLLGEHIGKYRILGLLLAFVGVVMVSFDPAALTYRDGLFIIVVASFSYALATVFMRQLEGIPLLSLQAWIALLGAPLLLIISGIFETDQYAKLMEASWYAKGSILYSAIGATIIGHGGLYYLIQRYPVSAVTPYTLLSQVFVVLLSVTFFGEVLGTTMIIGAIICFTGVLIIVLRNHEVVSHAYDPTSKRSKVSKLQP